MEGCVMAGRKKSEYQKLQSRIAELEDQLRRETTTRMYIADPSLPDIERIGHVLSYYETESGGEGELVRRSLSLAVMFKKRLLDRFTEDQLIAFRGRSYMIRSINIPTALGGRVRAIGATIDLECEGVATAA